MVSPKLLEELEKSMSKMELQLSKLRHEGAVLRE